MSGVPGSGRRGSSDGLTRASAVRPLSAGPRREILGRADAKIGVVGNQCRAMSTWSSGN